MSKVIIFITAYRVQCCVVAGALTTCDWTIGRVHPGQVGSLSQGWTESDNHSLQQSHILSQISLICMIFGLREEAGAHRTGTTWKRHTVQPAGLTHQHSCCEVTVLATAPPCHPESSGFMQESSLFLCLSILHMYLCNTSSLVTAAAAWVPLSHCVVKYKNRLSFIM